MSAIVLHADGRELALTGELLEIGRDLGCAVVVDADGVAPRHCRLVWSNGQWWIEYLGRGAAIAVIGRDQRADLVLTRRVLEPDDRIVIGHHAAPIWSAVVGGGEDRRAPTAPPPVDERVTLRAAIEELRGELAHARQARDATELALAHADDRRRQELAQLRHGLEGELSAAELRVKGLRGQLDALEARHAEETRRRKEAERERDDVRRELDAARAEIRKLLAAAQEQADLAEQRAQVIEEQERELAARRARDG